MKSLEKLDVTTQLLDGKWRVTYGGGTGGVIIDVDRRSGKATIVRVEQ
jgi:hypothetical protein